MLTRSVLPLAGLTVLAAAMAAQAAPATAADCNGRLIYVDDPSSVGDNYPLFMRTRRNLYVLHGNCFQLIGSEFRGSIRFFTLSRAPEGFSGTYGVLAVKSVRTFNIETQKKKIKLSRNGGWYLPNDKRQNAMTEIAPLPPVPISTSLADWNALHADPKSPESFEGLDVKWHAYPVEDRLSSSTTWANFWQQDAADFKNRLVTNYLIRFAVNPDKQSQTPVQFYVATPHSVERINLSIESNIGSLATNYTFTLK